ncbi:TIGR04255 family protein [Vibrio furnissii]|uniref:TIGR04255 family protein n=1 Tax=Vibrio furnissii TaxID=29494 RepID=UPI001EEA9A31|nr:TIGR04255 family protein [Vibrio furnissii]MCG6267997.1 TIGR04255 family protein [Vibrio furnissii]
MTEFKKLKNHPLVCTLIEVRFSSVLNLEHYIPQIQDKVRHQYPLFDRDSEQAVNVGPSGISVEKTHKYIFTTKDKMSNFQLTPDRLVFITKDYERFEGFAERCEMLLSVVAETINPSLYSRLGLRFSDCIKSTTPGSDAELMDLFNTKSVFFTPELSNLGRKATHRTETAIQVDDSVLVVRSVIGMTHMVTFEDLLQQKHVEIKPDEKPSVRVILDFDHFWQDEENQKDFNVDSIVASLHKLHETSRQAFWNVTSEYAREKVWS